MFSVSVTMSSVSYVITLTIPMYSNQVLPHIVRVDKFYSPKRGRSTKKNYACLRGSMSHMKVQCGSHDTVRNDLHTYIDVKQSIFFMSDTIDSPREPRKSTGAQPFIKLKGLWLTKISYAYPLLPRQELPFGSSFSSLNTL